jgi:crotonobetainyl-CoA:carnitine CoA-transferase CaiB-like acyl-CoA transferase
VDIIKRLAAKADVVVENFRPDVKHRLGIDYETLSKINPRLIYASISGFGQTGPYRDRPGYDQIAQGMGGLMSVTGLPGQGPVRVGIPVADLTAGIFLAQGVLCALIERERSGKGQWVHTSLLEAMVTMLDFQPRAGSSTAPFRPRPAMTIRPVSPRRVQDVGRPHQYRGLRPDHVPPALRGAGHRAAAQESAL